MKVDTYEDVEDMIQQFETEPWWKLTKTSVFHGWVSDKERDEEWWEYAKVRIKRIQNICHSWGYYLHKVSGFSGFRVITTSFFDEPVRGYAFIGVDPDDTANMILFSRIVNYEKDFSGDQIYFFENPDEGKKAFDSFLCDLGITDNISNEFMWDIRWDLMSRLDEDAEDEDTEAE